MVGLCASFYLVDTNTLTLWSKFDFRFCLAGMYYNPSTPPSGSADPLWRAMRVRSLLRTGWGPRGDSGSARGRVRATQPATFVFLLPPASQIRAHGRT